MTLTLSPSFLPTPSLSLSPPTHIITLHSLTHPFKQPPSYPTKQSQIQPKAILHDPPPTPTPSKPPSKTTRYEIRQATQEELFSVADVRCSAFYINPLKNPPDTYFFPTRRRDIYLALVDRVARGNRCVVAIDNEPAEVWKPFTNSQGGLVVGAVDASLYERGGRKWSFLRGGVVGDGFGDYKHGQRDGVWTVYISSMAVRTAWRGRGLARRLLEEVVDDGRRRGLEEVLLHVDEENEAALKLYLSSGFEPWKEQKQGWRVPKWLQYLAKKEHTLMVKQLIPLEKSAPDIDAGL